MRVPRLVTDSTDSICLGQRAVDEVLETSNSCLCRESSVLSMLIYGLLFDVFGGYAKISREPAASVDRWWARKWRRLYVVLAVLDVDSL